MNIKLYASLIAALVLNSYIPFCSAETLGADDVRGNVGNLSGLLDEKLNKIDSALGNKSIKEITNERFDELIRIGNKDIGYLKSQIEYYKSSPEMVTDFERKIKYVEQNVLKKTVALKASLETLSFVGNAINVYEYNEAAQKFFSDAENNRIEYISSVQPLLEKAAAFQPVAGGLIFIKDQVDKILDLSRGIGSEYSSSLSTILDQYSQQYHVIADRAAKGKPIEGLLELYKSQRFGMRQQLDDLYNEANTLIPYFGKDELLAAIKKARFDLLGEQNEPDIRAKQVATYDRFNNLEKSREEAAVKLKELNGIHPIDAAGMAKLVAINNQQPTNTQPQPSIHWATVTMQNQLSAITVGGTSHIGSAVYFTGRSPSVDSVRENRHTVAHLQTVREASQYTNGFIIKAPVDIVLRWGANPSDLDSHLTGPASANPMDATRFHTYYAAPGNLNAAPGALLYRDVTTGLGPEQTRINTVLPGVYRFYVHDFTNGGATNSTALSNSGAVVTLHQSGSLTLPQGQNLGSQVAAIPVPTNQVGTVWQAFELDTRTGILNRTTTFSNVSNPTSVPFNQ